MKTTDLIPIILYQLADGDKYGYEIVKQIEDLSSGSIVIKQPTLYSILKKLEQGRFISSYWQDSEIGGKRHYYKLTDNGKSQLETYPPIDKLIKEAIGEDNDILENKTTLHSPIIEEKNDIIIKNEEKSILDTKSTDYNEDIIIPSPIDITIPTTDTQFEANKLDVSDNISNINADIEIVAEDTPNTTITEQNSSYSSIFDAIEFQEITEPDTKLLETEKSEISEPSIKVEDAPKFTEKIEEISTIDNDNNKLYDQLSPSEDLIDTSQKIDKDLDNNTNNFVEEVKYLNYVDFSTDKSSIKRKNTIKNHIQKMCLTCITLLLAVVFSVMICNKYSYTRIYAISLLIVLLILIIYPIVILSNIHKMQLKYCSRSFRYSISRDFFIKFSLFLSLVIIIFAYNLTISTNVSNIFAINNFANFLCPIIFSSIILLDYLYSVILYKKYAKK